MTGATSKFNQKKQEILRQLSVPLEEYSDLSPKGSVDEGIRELVNSINALDGYVTTSSCAGRVAVFLEGAGKAERASVEASTTKSVSQGGKGGGSWLYISHEPLDTESVRQSGQLFSLLGLEGSPISYPAVQQGKSCRFVRFKFEPMILHVLTSNLSHAQRVHSAAMSAGFRESGIGGVVPGKVAGQSEEEMNDEVSPMVAIRTNGLAFDSIIAYQDDAGIIQPMVSEEYLRTVVHIANDRFEVNSERTKRFSDALFLEKAKCVGEWEPADVRRNRKRAEGLRKRDELSQVGNEIHGGSLASEEDLDFGSMGALLDDPT